MQLDTWNISLFILISKETIRKIIVNGFSWRRRFYQNLAIYFDPERFRFSDLTSLLIEGFIDPKMLALNFVLYF